MSQAGWYPDPNGVHEMRYYDGAQWTEHVSNGGVASTAPVTATATAAATGATAGRGLDAVDALGAFGTDSAERIQRQVVQNTGGAAVSAGTGDLFSEPVLVVNQKAKLFELNNEFSIFDAEGQKIGAVMQVGQSSARKALRLVSNLDSFMKVHFDICDAYNRPVLKLTRPGKVLKSTIIVSRPDGSEVGRIVQQNMIGKIRFGLEAGGHSYGSINAENWRAWNFSIKDHTETEVARVTKTFEGLAKAMFTTADNYVVQLHRPLEDPLRSLVLAAAVSVDTALKQNDSGGFIG